MWRLRLRRWRAARRGGVSPVLRRYWDAQLPDGAAPVAATPFLVCDGEMTGLDPARDELISLGWVSIEGGELLLGTGEHALIRAGGSVGVSATVHQLRDCELAAGDAIEAVLARFLEAAAGKIVVFHHAPLDLAFLDRAAVDVFGAPLLLPVVDTLRLEQRLLARQHEVLPEGVLRLHACRERYELPDHGAHNALADAIATGELLLANVARRGGRPLLRDLL